MGNFTISGGFENPRRGRQARNLATKVPKILDLKSSFEQIFSKNCRWMPLTVMITQNVTLSNTKKGRIQKTTKFQSWISANRPFRNRALNHNYRTRFISNESVYVKFFRTHNVCLLRALRWFYTRRLATTIFSVTKRCAGSQIKELKQTLFRVVQNSFASIKLKQIKTLNLPLPVLDSALIWIVYISVLGIFSSFRYI